MVIILQEWMLIDICLPTRIEKQVNLLDSKPNLIACGAQFERFGSMSRISSLPLTSSYCKINFNFFHTICPSSCIV